MDRKWSSSGLFIESRSFSNFIYKPIPKTFLESYSLSFQNRPSRIEPLYYVATYFFSIGAYQINYWLLKLSLAIGISNDTITVERWMIDWAIPYQLLQSAYNIGRYCEASDIALSLSFKKVTPR